MFQGLLLSQIRKKNASKSIIEEISKALDISYDAAHRRANLKSKISLDESVLLANYFGLSLDSLFGQANHGFISIQRTPQIHNENQLEEYLKGSYKSLKKILNKKTAKVFYSAKDIPVFHLLKSKELCRFKIYLWLNSFSKDKDSNPFHKFYPKLSTVQVINDLIGLYYQVSVSEIWDITTINSLLKQVYIFFKKGKIAVKEAIILCDSLKIVLKEIVSKAVLSNNNYRLYQNELLLVNNNVLICNEYERALFVPSGMLSYFKTKDEEICDRALKYFDKQTENSRSLDTYTEIDQDLFYKTLVKKIEVLIRLLKDEKTCA